MSEPIELYRKYRPQTFADVVGQKEAVQTLTELGKKKTVPHALLFTGPSGCGKTTLARIVATKLGCRDKINFKEINSAECRGIDEVRDIQARLGAAPIGDPCRVILIDEVHGMTGDAQNALLKILEEPPSHIYFLLATTDPQKLKKTIITRCTEIKCKAISEKDLVELIKKICDKEGKKLEDRVVNRIAEVSENSARKALVVLHQVINIVGEAEQLAAIESADLKSNGFEIAKLLFKNGAKWSDLAALLEKVPNEEAEAVRRVVLGYAKSVLLKSGNAYANVVIKAFWEPTYDTGASGLASMCYDVIG